MAQLARTEGACFTSSGPTSGPRSTGKRTDYRQKGNPTPPYFVDHFPIWDPGPAIVRSRVHEEIRWFFHSEEEGANVLEVFR